MSTQATSIYGVVNQLPCNIMATQDAKQAVLLSADPSLIFIWTSCEVDVDVQYKLVENGVKASSSVANLASDAKDFRAALEADLD